MGYFTEGYVASQPRRILAGQTMNYGWSTQRFVADEERNKLLIEELSNPHTSGETAYVPDATRAVALAALQEEVLRRLHITGESEHPHRSSTAIVCKRVTPETTGSLRPLGAQRLEGPDGRSSGWFLGCVGSGHDHDDADQLEQVHLVARFPGLFPYLTLPVGTALLFEAEQVIVFRPGEQEGHPDAAPLVRELP
jgi:hypothetical protein